MKVFFFSALAIVIVGFLAVNHRGVIVFLRSFIPLFLRKLPTALITLWAVATMVFFMTKAVGGEDIVGEKGLDPIVREKIIEKYGLNDPLPVQYLKTMKETLKLDSLPSRHQRNKTFRDVLKEHLPKSAALGFRAIILAIIFGVPIGIVCAIRHNRLVDQSGSVLALVGVSVPSFVLASLAIYFLSARWGLLSATEWVGVMEIRVPDGAPAFLKGPLGGLSALVTRLEISALWIPAACLGAFPFAAVLRLTRSSMLEALREDYVRTARAKGVSEFKVVMRHALRNSLSAVITYVGPVVAGILLGSLVVEKIFAIPGLGDMFVKTVENRDIPLIMGMTVFYSALLIFMNLLVDSLYPVLNPRLRDA